MTSRRPHWSTIVTNRRHGPARDCRTSGSTTARHCTIELAANLRSSVFVETTKACPRFVKPLRSWAHSSISFRSTASQLERSMVTTWSWFDPICMLSGAATRFPPTIALSPLSQRGTHEAAYISRGMDFANFSCRRRPVLRSLRSERAASERTDKRPECGMQGRRNNDGPG